MLKLATIGSVAALLAASPALACPSRHGVRALIHDAVPEEMPEGAVVLDVAFPDDRTILSRSEIMAQVKSVVRGPFEGDSVLVRMTERSSCHYPFVNGLSGLIVGHVELSERGPVMQPIYVTRGNDFRLPTGTGAGARRPSE